MAHIYDHNCGSNSCWGTCNNFSYNLIYTYYEYWLSKVEILNDPKGNLEDIFDAANLIRMLKGSVTILLDYGNGATIATAVMTNYDKNYNPVSANVQLNLNSVSTSTMLNLANSGQQIKAIAYWLFKPENVELLRNELIKLGISEFEIVTDGATSQVIQPANKEAIPFFKAIFWQNNLTETPSLQHLNKIVSNIHALDEANDKNHRLINAIYFAKTNKKLTPEQANNISVTITTDGYGVIVTDDGGDEIKIGDGLNKDVLAKAVNNWANIGPELATWEDKFAKYAGMPTDRFAKDRENLAESVMRSARVNAAEKRYYKYVKRFIAQYEEYHNIKLDYMFDQVIDHTMATAASNIGVTQPDINEVKTGAPVNEGDDNA